MSRGSFNRRGPSSTALTICLRTACSAIRPTSFRIWKWPQSLTYGGTATTVLSFGTAPTCSASGALGHPGAPTMSPSSAASSSGVLWLSTWRCPRAQCQAPQSCCSHESTIKASSLSANSVTSTQAVSSCSPPDGRFPALSNSDCSQRCSPQRSEDPTVQRLLLELSIWNHPSHQRSQQEPKPEPLRQPRALNKRPRASRLCLRVVLSTRTPPPLHLPKRPRVSPL